MFLRFEVWAAGMIVGFAGLHWGAGAQMTAVGAAASFAKVLYFSGVNFFTLGLGEATPHSALPAALNVLEAATGFMFLGLIISSYLPVFYTEYADREVHIAMLDEWAGSPPSAGDLLRRIGQDGAQQALNPFLEEWEEWAAEVLESHLSYPVLCFFRSQHENQSWVSALATLLDVCALAQMGIEGVPPRTAKLTFAIARHAAVDLGQAIGDGRQAPPLDRLPPEALARLRTMLRADGIQLAEGVAADARLRELRGLYEPYLGALAEALWMPLPGWLPAGEEAKDNWQRSADGHATGG